MSLICVVEWCGVGKMNASNVIDRQIGRQTLSISISGNNADLIWQSFCTTKEVYIVINEDLIFNYKQFQYTGYCELTYYTVEPRLTDTPE